MDKSAKGHNASETSIGSLGCVVGLPTAVGTKQIGAMRRQPGAENPRLEELLDERDHLRIQLSLALDAMPTNEERIRELRLAVSDVESQIGLHQSRP